MEIFIEKIMALIAMLQKFGIPLAIGAFVVGGFVLMFGGSDSGRKSKPIFICATIGTLIILGAVSIGNFLQSIFVF